MILKRPFLVNILVLVLMLINFPVTAAVSKYTQTRSLIYFNHIVAEGRVSLHLHTGYNKSKLILRGNPVDLAKVSSFVSDDTLFIKSPPDYPKAGPIIIDVQTRDLNSLSYRGAGLISGSKLNTRFLDLNLANAGRTVIGGTIYLHKLVVSGPGYTEISGIVSPYLFVRLQGDPKVKLVGMANLARLDLDGNGSLSMYWVRSYSLKVRQRGAGSLELGGIASKLDLELWGRSKFNGRYLRADVVFAKTHEHAVAEIAAVNKQHTLATDASDIFFYDIPDFKTDFMAYNGAVLDMRDLSPPVVQEYSRYNK